MKSVPVKIRLPKIKIPPKVLKITGIALGILILTATSAAAYVGLGNDISFEVGGKQVDFVNRGGFRPSIKDKGIGCCYPLCGESTQPECAGFEWHKGGCNLIPGCDKGCCVPLCEELSKVHCEGDFGHYPADYWTSQSCNKLEECEEGCCEYQCVVEDMKKGLCEHPSVGGTWQKGECKTGCCELEGGSFVQLPQETCEKCHSGSKWREGGCPKGFKVHMEGKVGGQALQDEFLDAILEGFTGDVVHGKVEMTVDAYTCEETPLSTWKGEITTKTTASNPAVGTKTDTDTDSVTMPFSEKQKSYGLPGLFTAKIEGMTMQVTLNLIVFAEPLILKGTITQGASECEEPAD